MRKYYSILLVCFLLFSLKAYSQEDSTSARELEVSEETEQEGIIDLTTFQLPPLSLLYANARKNPSIEILEKEKQLQKRLLSKEKKNWLSFFSTGANVSYGVTDSYSVSSNAITPILTQNGSEQLFWNVNGGISIPLEGAFDVVGKVKRQRIAVEKADLQKELAFDQLKQQIITLYVQIQANIELLKSSLEYMALYKGVTASLEQEFKNRRGTIEDVANAKKREFEANSTLITLQASIQEQLLMLEIISRTSFVSNSIQE